MITKSLYLKGRQCPKRLWLASRGVQEPALEPEKVWDERAREGQHVEAYAERLFPGGVAIADAGDDEDEPPAGLDERARRTGEALRRARPVFQAHLRAGDLLAVADILEPRGSGWFLWEVKASTHDPGKWTVLFDWDLAFQVLVAREVGLDVVGAGVILLSSEFVRGGGDIDPDQLLVRVDRTADVERLQPDVRGELASLRGACERSASPVELPAARCKAYRDSGDGNRPSSCGHLAREGECGKTLPGNWAGRLPGLRGARADYVYGQPGLAIEDLDPDDPARGWPRLQRLVIEAVHRGEPRVDPDRLRKGLGAIEWPVAYVDFEFDTGMAVPRFEGCRPYERIPFQWALVVQREPGARLEAPRSFLHLDADDPSRPFAESFLEAVPESGSLVAHHASAEQGVLRRLAERLGGGLGERLLALNSRFQDTETISRPGYYHPAQQGSWSIKKLAPALVGRGYEDLEIDNGMAAVLAWRKALGADGVERERLRAELLEYCGRDAELMHRILEALRRLSAEGTERGAS